MQRRARLRTKLTALYRGLSARTVKLTKRLTPRFSNLRSKLTVLYGGLFAIAFLVIAGAVHGLIADNAAQTVRNELSANGAVFDRLWQERENQFGDSADLLAHDFGFREAVATGDAPTIQSALVNLRDRLGLDRALMMTLDGDVVGADNLDAAELDALWAALDADPRAAGVLTLGGRPYQAVAAPIMAPDLIGWVVFAAELNPAYLQSFERLAAIPLKAEVFTRDASGAWRSEGDSSHGADIAALGAILNTDTETRPQAASLADGAAIVLAKSLRTVEGSGEARLVLRYSLALAMRPYQIILAIIAGLGVIGVMLLAFGSWGLARTLTKPIADLDEAAQALQQGKRATVAVQTDDEIGRLAQSFNIMSQEIADREQRITYMALHDSETGLANRRTLEQMLETLCAPHHGSSDCVFIAAISINRFNHIRGAIGYSLAATLLQLLGSKIIAAHDVSEPARIASDTLAILVKAANPDAACALLENLRDKIEGPVRLSATTVDIGVTFGVAEIADAADLAAFERAMIALDQAHTQSARIAIFDAALYGDPASNLSLMSEMIDGIHRGQLALHYQPKHDFRANCILGVEALVRWTHPTRGPLSPDLFVTMAEQTGHIAALTEWTLIQAIGDQMRMIEAGHDLIVSVNLSGRLVGDDAFTEMVIGLVQDTGAKICLEITETAAMNDPEAARANIARYAEAGVLISIDDYGAGLSSLSYLKEIRAQELKMDKSFLQSLDANPRDALVIKSTIDLAHGLGMKVTAEGVETAAVMALLAGMGCDTAQGYFIAKAAPVEKLLQLLDGLGEAVDVAQKPGATAGAAKVGA